VTPNVPGPGTCHPHGNGHDRADRALDVRRYGDSIPVCRGLLNMWERRYGATAKRRIAELIGDERRWSTDHIRRKLLDALWKEIRDVAKDPHHPEGDVGRASIRDLLDHANRPDSSARRMDSLYSLGMNNPRTSPGLTSTNSLCSLLYTGGWSPS
jgi:hypothetical protein